MGVESAVDETGSGFVSVEIQFYGTADMTYTAIGLHKAHTNDWDSNYANWPLVAIDYYDYYDFGFFENQGIFEPFSYSFLGPGPLATRPSAPILLGSTTDEASVTTAGAPHHVQVVKDKQGVVCAGGIQIRQITVQIVDASNKKITTSTSVSETYSNLTTNTCHNGNPVPSSCAPTQRGTFIDSMAVTQTLCNSTIDPSSGCGYTLTSTWSVCSGSPQPDVWTYNGETRSNLIKVNNSTQFAKGTYLYP